MSTGLGYKRLCLGLLAAVTLLSATRSYAQEYSLSIAHVLDPQHSVHVGAERFKQVVEERSDGRVEVNLFPGGMLGDSRELALQMQSGAIFGVIDATTKFVNFVPEFGLLDIPFLATDTDGAFALMDHPKIADLIYAKAIEEGFRPLHGWEVSFRNIYTKEQTVNKPDDLAGLKIRTIPSPTYINLFQSFGASPTPMNFGELYTSLQQGVVDGAENDSLTYLSSKHYEVAPLLSITGHMMLVNTLFVSEKLWNDLPEDIRDIIVAASLEARQAAMADSDKRQAVALEDLRAQGVTVTEPDLEPFIEAARQTRSYFEKVFGPELVETVEGLAESG